MTLPGWGRKVLLLAIIPVPHYTIIAGAVCEVQLGITVDQTLR